MNKLPMIVMGKQALVDVDMVKKIIRKQQLVDRVVGIQAMIKLETDETAKAILKADAGEFASQIIRLNRTIRQGCVQFL